MKNYLLILNGKAVADYFTRGRALNGFKRFKGRIRSDDMLQLIDLNSCIVIAFF